MMFDSSILTPDIGFHNHNSLLLCQKLLFHALAMHISPPYLPTVSSSLGGRIFTTLGWMISASMIFWARLGFSNAIILGTVAPIEVLPFHLPFAFVFLRMKREMLQHLRLLAPPVL